jgi:hypothetical protein
MQTPDSSGTPPTPRKPADPLQNLVAGLDRASSKLEPIPPASAAGPTGAKSAQTQTMYSYNPPVSPRERPTEKGKRSGLLLAIGVAAAAMPLIVALAVVLPRFLPQRNNDGGNDEPVAAAAEEDSAPQDDKQTAVPVKPKNSRALFQRPVTAKPSSANPAKRPAPKPGPVDSAAGKSGSPTTPQGTTTSNLGLASSTPSQAVPAAAPSKPFQPGFEGLPKAVDLPALTEIDKPVLLGKLEVPENVRCQMTVVYGIKEELLSYQFSIGSNADEPRVWRISTSEKVPPALEPVTEAKQPTEIAQLELESGQLFFRWLPDCVKAPADRLRNALLWVTVENQKHRLQLRKPSSSQPLVLDLEETAQEVSFSAAVLPPLEAVQFELLDATAPAIAGAQPPSRRVRGDESLRLIVRNGLPAFELRLQLKVDGNQADVRVEPCLVDTDGEVMPLTISGLNTMQKELPLEIRRTERELEDVRADRASLQTRIARTERSISPGQASTQLAALRTSLGKLMDKERTLAQRIPMLQQRAKVLPDFEKVADQMHHKTQLRFRVFFVSGGEEVTLLGM